jgi:hypothetical protein
MGPELSVQPIGQGMSLAVHTSRFELPDAGTCAVGRVLESGSLRSTGLTCSGVGEDTDEDVATLAQEVGRCLDVPAWAMSAEVGAPANLVAPYGQFKFSITRNGARGLALGLEVFRDADGQVRGSPLRGNQPVPAGTMLCTPKSSEEVARLMAMYASRPGARPFVNDEFHGVTNDQSSPAVAFITRPAHPAHPAIVVRSVEATPEGFAVVSSAGDFAGDCLAFHDLMAAVNAMNRRLAN